MSYKHLEVKLRVVLAGHIVGMVYNLLYTKNAVICLPIEHLYDTVIASLVKQWEYSSFRV